MRKLNPDTKRRCHWIEKNLGQLGIDVRQSGQHQEMLYYLELLKEELAMTKQFLREDNLI